MVFHDDGFPLGASILADINQFVRGNPLLSTAILGASLTGITAGVVRIRRRKKKSVSTQKRKRKSTRKKIRGRGIRKRTKRVTHSSPRHKGHKRVAFTTKEGKRVTFLVKKPKHQHKRR